MLTHKGTGRAGRRWSHRKRGLFVDKTVIARAERGISCSLYFSFYLPSPVTTELSLQEGQRHWMAETPALGVPASLSLTLIPPSPFWGSSCSFSCSEGKSQGNKTRQPVLLATQMLPHLWSTRKIFSNRPWLNSTVATSWSLHVNSTHIWKQLGSLCKYWHSQSSTWSPAQVEKLSAVHCLQ